MRFSLIITLRNEENTIKSLLEALGRQTKTPDEIIIVDGGSEDGTLQILSEWANNKKNIKIFFGKNFNIAQGRNFGISKSKGSVVVLTDAGCVPHKDWFEKITQPFNDPKTDIVSGFYRMTGDSSFQKCVSLYLGKQLGKMNQVEFLPSARSMAFRKKIWQRIGGFSDKLKKAGEDTLFNYYAVKLGAKFCVQDKAMVDWGLPKSLKEASLKFYFYAQGDGQANIWWHPKQKINTHNLKIMTIYFRYIIELLIIFMTIKFGLPFWFPILFFVFYIFWTIEKNYHYLKIWQAIFWLPILQFVSDFSVMIGFMKGQQSKI